MLLRLGQIYEGDFARLPAELHPRTLRYHAEYLGVDLRNGLSCIIDDAEIGASLASLIDDLVDVIKLRLKLTEEVMELTVFKYNHF